MENYSEKRKLTESRLQQLVIFIQAIWQFFIGWISKYILKQQTIGQEGVQQVVLDTTSHAETRQLAQSPSFLHVYNRIYLALLHEQHAEIISKSILTFNYVIVPLTRCQVEVEIEQSQPGPSDRFHPPSLGDIFKFDEIASSLQRKHPRMKLVFQAGEDKAIQLKMAFLIGCHMMMRHDCGFEETYLSFKGMQSLFDSKAPESADTVSITSCWRAFYCAKRLNWMEFDTVATETTCDNRCIHMDEYMHYARWRTTECYVPMFAQDT